MRIMIRVFTWYFLTNLLLGDNEKHGVLAIYAPTVSTAASAPFPQHAPLPLATALNSSLWSNPVSAVSAAMVTAPAELVETATKSLSSSSAAATAAATTTTASTTSSDSSSAASQLLLLRQDMMIAFLGVMSGFSGVLCFRRFGCYINMMTGNVARLAHAVADCEWKDALFYVFLIGSYGMGTFLYRVLEIRQQQQQQLEKQKEKAEDQVNNNSNNNNSNKSNTTKFPRAMIPTFWTLFLLADLIDKAPPLPTKCMIPFLSAGFAMINSYSQSALGSITNAATGHWTRMGMGMADSLLLGTPFWSKRRTSWAFVAGFASSSLVASILYVRLSNNNTIHGLPMGMTFGLFYTFLLSWYNGPAAVPSSSWSLTPRGNKYRLQAFSIP